MQICRFLFVFSVNTVLKLEVVEIEDIRYVFINGLLLFVYLLYYLLTVRLPYPEKVGVIRPISRDSNDENNKGAESPELKPRPFTTTTNTNRVNNNNNSSNNNKELTIIEKSATVSVPIESWLKNTQVSGY